MPDFVPTIRLSDIPVGQVRAVDVQGTAVALARTADGVFALKDQCSHQDVALSEGDVVDCSLECWLHGSAFDLRTGEPLGPPAVTRVPTFEVRTVGESESAVIHVATEPRTIASP